jgi:hypothetical protein
MDVIELHEHPFPPTDQSSLSSSAAQRSTKAIKASSETSRGRGFIVVNPPEAERESEFYPNRAPPHPGVTSAVCRKRVSLIRRSHLQSAGKGRRKLQTADVTPG